MSDQHPNSEIPAHHSPFEHPLSYFADRFNSAGPIKIVAIGSSSTAGGGRHRSVSMPPGTGFEESICLAGRSRQVQESDDRREQQGEER